MIVNGVVIRPKLMGVRIPAMTNHRMNPTTTRRYSVFFREAVDLLSAGVVADDSLHPPVGGGGDGDADSSALPGSFERSFMAFPPSDQAD